jgi:uncharacterized membrane protein
MCATLYLVNYTKKQYVFLDEGYNVKINWIFKPNRNCNWNITDDIRILNTNGDGFMLFDNLGYDDDTESLYEEINNSNK